MSDLFRAVRISIACMTLLLGTVLENTGHARSDEGDSRSVELFSEENFSGSVYRWRLPPGEPFLAVPQPSPPIESDIRSLRIGGDVGLLLFDLPNFAGRDDRCGPKVGGEEDPSMWWRGLTAEGFIAVEGGNGSALTLTRAPRRPGSLIVFSRESGPPPAVLLLARRGSYDHSCGDALYASQFGRLVVPVSAPPKASHCVDLGDALAGADQEALSARTDEAFLLTARRLDSRYENTAAHAARFVLYDRDGCEGQSIAFSTPENSASRIRLSEFGYDGRVRSVQAIYEAGPWRDLYEISGREQTAESKIGPTNAPASPSSTDKPDADEPQLAEATSAESASSDVNGAAAPAQPTFETSAPTTPKSPMPLPAEAVPQPSYLVPEDDEITLQPALPPPPEFINLPRKAQKLSPSLEEQASTSGFSTQSFGEDGGGDDFFMDAPQFDDVIVPQVIVPDVSASSPETEQEVVEDPGLDSVLPTEASSEQTSAAPAPDPDFGTLDSEAKTFRFPVHAGYRLNYCYKRSDRQCGETAAQAWCQDKGYEEAVSWKRELHIGALFPTIFMGDDEICEKFLCDGFEEVTCAGGS